MSAGEPFESSSKRKATVILLVTTISVTAIAVCVILYLLHGFWRSLLRRSRTTPFDSTPPLNGLQVFGYKELEIATKCFRESNTIGRGGSGIVYRGVLKDGKLVAVKRLDSTSLLREEEFQNELKILGGLKSFAHVVCLLGFCVEKGHKFLVYEYMPNKSLQESLFTASDEDESADNLFLSWVRRFSIILDVAKALAFLQLECDPAVIHGDVKPSNVLLDSDFRAKLSDFGLSRIRLDDEIGLDLFSQDLGRSRELSGNLNIPLQVVCESEKSLPETQTNVEVDFPFTLQASSAGKTGLKIHRDSAQNSDKDRDKLRWSGELRSKDYVKEWIGSHMHSSASPDWDEEMGDYKEHAKFSGSERFKEVVENPVSEKCEFKEFEISPLVKAKKSRTMREWWEEEHKDDKVGKVKKSFKPHFGLGKSFQFQKKKLGRVNHVELSFRNSCRSMNSRSMRTNNVSEDPFSRELSSTTSMRGTLCYVAPEYNGSCGVLMEKADVYSFGVLMLVIISGRRPLNVLSSPIKMEKANLINWSRFLFRSGNVLELIDERLKDVYDKDQARLCVHLAISCLQKAPELRPDIGDIVKILEGEMELASLPLDFSPSPSPSGRKHI